MSNLIEFIKDQKDYFLPVLSDDKISWEKESQFAIQSIQENDYLKKVAENNVVSLQNAIVNIASIGISLNPVNKHAYLVPRNKKVCLDISYRGLLHLAIQSGSISWGQCKLVYFNDQYSSCGLDKAPFHEYNPYSKRGDLVGSYCTVKTSSGDYLTDEMTLSEIIKIQNLSESMKSEKGAKYSPWVNFFDEMARKTNVKRASKYWPTNDRLNNAVNYLNNDAGEGISLEKDITPEFIDENQFNTLLNLLCDETGMLTNKGLKIQRAYKFNSIEEVPSSDFDKIIAVAS